MYKIGLFQALLLWIILYILIISTTSGKSVFNKHAGAISGAFSLGLYICGLLFGEQQKSRFHIPFL